jgi:hypothetical protein
MPREISCTMGHSNLKKQDQLTALDFSHKESRIVNLLILFVSIEQFDNFFKCSHLSSGYGQLYNLSFSSLFRFQLWNQCMIWVSYQNASFHHIHGRVGENLLLDDAHGKLTENTGWASLDFNLKRYKLIVNFSRKTSNLKRLIICNVFNKPVDQTRTG